MPINVIIADDHPILRKGIVASLKKHSDISITYEAQNGDEVVQWLKSNTDIDILLLDLNMPKMSGMDVLEEIKLHSYSIKTIVLSMDKEEDIIKSVIKAGANGYICKEEDDETIYTAIKSVMTQGYYFGVHANKIMLHNMLDDDKKFNSESNKVINFSQREIKVIQYLSQEMTNEEIAKEMYCSIRTIEAIRQELIHKAGARNGIGLVLYAKKHKLIA